VERPVGPSEPAPQAPAPITPDLRVLLAVLPAVLSVEIDPNRIGASWQSTDVPGTHSNHRRHALLCVWQT
jgi:hypothetical protein